MSILCFYHKADLDGHCSAALIRSRFPTVKLFGVDYGDSLPLNEIDTLDRVFIVDFCFPPEEMYELAAKCPDVIWIDHHETAIKRMKDYGSISDNFSGIWVEGKAGCELTWQFIFPDDPIPLYVKLLGRYDVWDHVDPRVLPFQYGMRLRDTRVEKNFNLWETLDVDDSFFDQILEEGKLIFDYETEQYTRAAKSISYEKEFLGLRAIVANRSGIGTLFFQSVYDPDKHDLMIYWHIKDDYISVSLRSAKDDVNVASLASKFGGGGHPGAAGFRLPCNMTSLSLLTQLKD